MNRGTRALLVALLLLGVAAAFLLWRAEQSAGDDTSPVPRDEWTDAALPDAPRGDGGAHQAATVTALPPAAPHAKAPAAAATVRSKWGSGRDELGRARPQEGNPEAPMSLTSDRDGTLVVVDQVNDRLVRIHRDGTRDVLPSPVQAPQDVTIARDGTMLVLDGLAGKTVAVMSPEGRLLGELALEGLHVPEGGGVTGVFADGDGVFVEREHGALVRVGDTRGKADEERAELPGRPSRDGRSYLAAALVDGPGGRVLVTSIDRAGGLLRFSREVRLGEAVAAIVLLDSDRSGLVYLGLLVQPRDAGAGHVVLVGLDGEGGHPVARRDVPANAGTDETFREFTVLDDGGVVYLHRDDAGVSLERWELR